MVAQRRFGLLMALVCVGLVVLWLRLFQVQVVEHEVWAREAANLVRSSEIVPYHRGRIRDRNGVVLVRDEELYTVEFVYRDFRRGHPLGQVVHARSALELRAVPLDEALAHYAEWGRELVLLSPADLARFGRGGALPALGIDAVGPDAGLRRGWRASDVRYYVGQLLELDRKEWARLRKLDDDAQRERPLVELVASWREDVTPAELFGRLEGDLAAARDHLARLAYLCELEPGPLEPTFDHPTGDLALDLLVRRLETTRRDVEDAAASDLFHWSTGFPAGRVETALLTERFDLDWLAAVLCWDRARLEAWIDERRPAWLAWRDAVAVPSALVRLEGLSGARELCDGLLDELAALVAAPTRRREQDADPGWRTVDDLVVLAELESLFEWRRGARPAVPARVLPIQDPRLRRMPDDPDRPWKHAAYAYAPPQEGDPPFVPGGFVDPQAAARAAAEVWDGPQAIERAFARVFADKANLRGEDLRLRAIRLVDSWEARLQAAIGAAIDAGASPAADDGAVVGRLSMDRERVDRAIERSRYVLRDHGSRDVRLAGAPAYDLVHHVTRHPHRSRGFYVRDRTRRIALQRDENGVPIAEPLIGHVRESNLREVLGQRPLEARLRELQRKRLRTEQDQSEISELTASLYRWDEMHGGSGLERYLDEELRGQNGYRETEGMQERSERGRRSVWREPENGKDVWLTLDLELQRAALDTLMHPEHEPSDPRRDPVWLQNPVGAIVLATPDGRILVAASVPTVEHDHAPPSRDGERRVPRERTLRKPTFHPPGSVFKPFVAAWMLEERGFDPGTQYECEQLHTTGFAGYKTMSCNVKYGHKWVDLREAIKRSCNTYFAHLGEQCSVADLQAVCDLFGFGRPTGVKFLGPERGGIREEEASLGLWEHRGRPDERTERVRLQGANGLAVIQATPMQVARATCGLLTGVLPEMHLVGRIGDEEVAPRGERLPVSRENLAFVREAMAAVVDEPLGTGHGKGLERGDLGFTLALKTGSADYFTLREPYRHEAATNTTVRKHTWVAGWFPREDPQAVLVVYLHDTVETSSHSAVYVARQFLSTEAVRSFLSQRGVAVEGPR